MKIEVIGPGCSKCKELVKRTEQALSALGKKEEVEKVSDMDKIIESGVAMTPALRINGKIFFEGTIPEVKAIEKVLK